MTTLLFRSSRSRQILEEHGLRTSILAVPVMYRVIAINIHLLLTRRGQNC
jgi:hypothetical protein